MHTFALTRDRTSPKFETIGKFGTSHDKLERARDFWNARMSAHAQAQAMIANHYARVIQLVTCFRARLQDVVRPLLLLKRVFLRIVGICFRAQLSIFEDCSKCNQGTTCVLLS